MILVSSFAMGTTILLGQQIGSGKKEKGGRTVGTAILLFAGIAAIMSVILVVFAPQVSSLMNAPEEAFKRPLIISESVAAVCLLLSLIT